MKTSVVAVLLSATASVAVAATEPPVMFHVTIKSDRGVESPRFLATVGEPATVRLADGVAVEALAKPMEADGRAWTQVRITYFDTPDSKFVQEMSMHHQPGQRTGSFEYTDPTNRRFVIEIGDAARK